MSKRREMQHRQAGPRRGRRRRGALAAPGCARAGRSPRRAACRCRSAPRRPARAARAAFSRSAASPSADERPSIAARPSSVSIMFTYTNGRSAGARSRGRTSASSSWSGRSTGSTYSADPPMMWICAASPSSPSLLALAIAPALRRHADSRPRARSTRASPARSRSTTFKQQVGKHPSVFGFFHKWGGPTGYIYDGGRAAAARG